MDNNIQIFNNEELGTIRIKGTPDAPLFCLAMYARCWVYVKVM